MGPIGYEPLNMLKPVVDGFWIIGGSHISFYGTPFATRMTIIRLWDGGLWLHSPTQPEAGLLDQIRALGPIDHLIAPNWTHYASVGQWSEAFPDAQVWAAPGVAERAASRKVAIRVDQKLSPGTVAL